MPGFPLSSLWQHVQGWWDIIEELESFFDGGGKSFIHKGTNGRWRDVLSTEEIAACDEAAARNLTPECARWLRTGALPD